MKKWMMLAALLMIAGCNTVEGFGEDMQKGGENLQNAAERNKDPNAANQ